MFSQFNYPQQGNISVAFVNNGIQGAQQFTVGAGNTVVIFDTDHKQFFIKEVGLNGFPKPLRVCTYEEQVQQSNSDYVTRKEFNILKEMLEKINKGEVKVDVPESTI